MSLQHGKKQEVYGEKRRTDDESLSLSSLLMFLSHGTPDGEESDSHPATSCLPSREAKMSRPGLQTSTAKIIVRNNSSDVCIPYESQTLVNSPILGDHSLSWDLNGHFRNVSFICLSYTREWIQWTTAYNILFFYWFYQQLRFSVWKAFPVLLQSVFLSTDFNSFLEEVQVLWLRESFCSSLKCWQIWKGYLQPNEIITLILIQRMSLFVFVAVTEDPVQTGRSTVSRDCPLVKKCVAVFLPIGKDHILTKMYYLPVRQLMSLMEKKTCSHSRTV